MLYTFGDYALDPSTRTLRHGEALVDLTPKVFQTLLVLVENHERVMSKDELYRIIWPNQFVEESNLSQNISVLRKALGEATSGKKYIGTFPGVGYRFLEPVFSNSVREANSTGRSFSEVAIHETIRRTSHTDAAPPSSHHHSHAARSGRRSVIITALCFVLLILCAGIAYRKAASIAQRPDDEAPDDVKIFAHINGALYQPSWSMDGKTLAFVGSNPDRTQSSIYIQSVDAVQPHRVTYGPGIDSSPAWSPDGKVLAYLHMQPNYAAIILVNVERGTSRVLTTVFPHRYGLNCRHLDWSFDGRFLVIDDKNIESEPLGLYLVYISNGRKVRLTYPSTDIIGDVSPRISPDGTQVAFIRMKYQMQNDVFVVPTDAGTPRRLTGQSTVVSDVGWDANNKIIFSAKYDDRFRFWQIDLRARQTKVELASLLGEELPVQFSVARDTRRIAFSAYRPDLNIWSLDLTKGPTSTARWVPVIQTFGEDVEPSMSPDGDKLAFLSDVSGKMQIWVSRPNGFGASRVDTGSFIPANYCWSADSQSIVFSPTLTHGLYEVKLSDRSVRRLSTFLSNPFCSSDGKSLFARTHFSIYRVSMSDGKIEKLTEQGGEPIAQSKDGRYLYFGQGRMASTIARLDQSTGHQEIIVNSLIPGYAESWALAPQAIIFLGEQSGRPVVVKHDLKTGREVSISDFAGGLPPVEMSGFSLSPDGRRLLVVRADPMSAGMRMTTLAP